MNLTQFYVQFGDETQMGVAKILESTSRVTSVLPVQKIDKLSHRYNKETSLGEVGTRVINQAAVNTKGSTTEPIEERIEIAYARMTTDHRVEKASDGKARATEQGRRVRVIGKQMDNDLINADAAADKTKIDGLKVRAAGSQLISAGTNGAQLTLDLFNDLIDASEDMGGERYVFTNKIIARKLKNLILAAASGATVADVTAGTFKYEGVNVVALDRNEKETPLLDFNETQGTATTCTSLYCVSTSPEDEVGVKQLMASNSIELVPEGIVGGQYIDLIEVAFGLAIYDKRAMSRLQGVLQPA